MCEIFSDPYQEAGFEKKTENVCEKEIKEEELRKEGGREGKKKEEKKRLGAAGRRERDATASIKRKLGKYKRRGSSTSQRR